MVGFARFGHLPNLDKNSHLFRIGNHAIMVDTARSINKEIRLAAVSLKNALRSKSELRISGQGLKPEFFRTLRDFMVQWRKCKSIFSTKTLSLRGSSWC